MVFEQIKQTALQQRLNSDVVKDKERTWIWQQAKELAITGAFENFNQVVQALQILNSGLDLRDVLKGERALINKLCTRNRRAGAWRSLRKRPEPI